MKQFFHTPQREVMRNLHRIAGWRGVEAVTPFTHVGVFVAALPGQNQGVVS
ncbi:hypothetical protein [Cupriavidus sp. IK-TO18]|uniref:hypothetical protein n=1 Tax=Cupriavidus sp. IK-TO18 TaxID=2782182 RepID=UPI0018984363|nr:hypothetical protein [Cupriavidus sp. IK-TO18]MBF6991828.1 hypothetical protein [Cupriavidus sp. IK-TO18]